MCDGITRTAGGTINGFNNTLINIGGTETAGYDLNVRWAMPETSVGRFTLNWQNTLLDKFIESTETAAGFVETNAKERSAAVRRRRIRNGSLRCLLTGDSMTSEPRQRFATPTHSLNRAASERSRSCVRTPLG